jgi:ribosomal-protein-alanine N-acetyltransferase
VSGVAVARDAAELPQLELRPMRADDLGAVMAIERSAYPFPWTEVIFGDCLRVGYTCCVLEFGVIVVGYAIIAVGAGEAHLLNLCVRDEFRCRGLGRRLLHHVLDAARAAGAAVVFLEVRPANTGAVRLYESQGFHQIGIRRGYYQGAGGREDALVMRRALDAAEAQPHG